MLIRPVETDDKLEWRRMRSSLWPDSPDDHLPEIDHFFENPSDKLATFVAENRRGEICGFIEAGMRPYAEGCQSSPVGYVEGLWVSPDYRKSGVGRALVAAAENWARGFGLSEMASDAEVGNRESQDAHRALGYEEAERIVCFRKEL